jgi:hypothetical protein
MSEGSTPDRDKLALPDYDQLPIGSLEARIRTLDVGGVRQLLDYEQAHGDRLPVVQLLKNRIEALEAGAEPSDGSPTAARPETAGAPDGGSKVSPDTVGPATNPPSQGVPTNPAQPRT